MQRPSVDMFGPLQGGPQPSQQQQQQMQGPQQRFPPQSSQPPQQQQGGMDHDQLGIEFVLASVNHQQPRGGAGPAGTASRYLGPATSQLPHATRPH